MNIYMYCLHLTSSVNHEAFTCSFKLNIKLVNIFSDNCQAKSDLLIIILLLIVDSFSVRYQRIKKPSRKLTVQSKL